MTARGPKSATAVGSPVGLRRTFSVPLRDMEASPFSAILADFLARVPGALAAALVDAGGETVDYAGKYDLFELKVMAAHFRILLGTAGALVGDPDSPPRTLLVRGEKRTVLAILAPEGYAVVVVLGRRAGFTRREIATGLLMRALSSEAAWTLAPSLAWISVVVRADRRGRPLELVFDAREGTQVEVLGTFGSHGYRVRSDAGHEFSLVREPNNCWYADTTLDPKTAPT